MVNPSERSLAHGLGIAGGLLVALGGVFALALGLVDILSGRFVGAAGAIGEAIVLGVVGALMLLFAHLGARGWSDRPVACGVVLVVLAVVSWALGNPGLGLPTLVGGILALVAGVLYLVGPATRAITTAVSPG
jgi:hypothetical protein